VVKVTNRATDNGVPRDIKVVALEYFDDDVDMWRKERLMDKIITAGETKVV
jgi:hypothetical protein